MSTKQESIPKFSELEQVPKRSRVRRSQTKEAPVKQSRRTKAPLQETIVEEVPKKRTRVSKSKVNQETSAESVNDNLVELVVNDGDENNRNENNEELNNDSNVSNVSNLQTTEKIDAIIHKLKTESQEHLLPTKWVRHQIRVLKEIRKEVQKLEKKKTRAPRTHVEGRETGFLKPVPISSELASFVGVEKGSLCSRASVTKAICSYIKEHNLKNPERPKEIIPDKKLKSLLKYDETYGPITYTNYHTLLKPHYLTQAS